MEMIYADTENGILFDCTKFMNWNERFLPILRQESAKTFLNLAPQKLRIRLRELFYRQNNRLRTHPLSEGIVLEMKV